MPGSKIPARLFCFAGRDGSDCALMAGKSTLSAEDADSLKFSNVDRFDRNGSRDERGKSASSAKSADRLCLLVSQEMEKGESRENQRTKRRDAGSLACGAPAAARLRRCALGSKVRTVFEKCAPWKMPRISSKVRSLFRRCAHFGAHLQREALP